MCRRNTGIFLENELVDYCESDMFISFTRVFTPIRRWTSNQTTMLFWEFRPDAMRHYSKKTCDLRALIAEIWRTEGSAGARSASTRTAHGGGWLTCLDAISGPLLASEHCSVRNAKGESITKTITRSDSRR